MKYSIHDPWYRLVIVTPLIITMIGLGIDHKVWNEWWFFHVCSLGAYIALPVALGRRWYNRLFGAIAMVGLWCLIMFTESGQLWMCYHDPYRTDSCYVTLPQQHIDPPLHWWKNPPLP